MELWRLWVLRGPNTWATCPVIEAGLDVSAWAGQPRQQSAATVERLLTWLPSLANELGGACEKDEGGRMKDEKEAAAFAGSSFILHPSSFPSVLQRLVVHLQVLAGNRVQFSGLRPSERTHRYRLAFEYQEESVGQACLQSALALLRAAWEGKPYAIDDELRRLHDLADDQELGPSTFGVVEAARARQIPVDHFNPEDGRYLRLGQGARQRRSLASETDDISALARSITTDKHLTKLLLREAGVPVPIGRPVSDADDAWKAACELGLPVAVKPQDRDLALGVGVNLRTREQVLAAYEIARAKSSSIMVERFLVGIEHRVLVVGDRVAAVARIEPPRVLGDGVSCIADLVAAVNRDPRRGDAYPSPWRRIKLDAVAIELLAGQGYTLESIPPRGARVLLRRDPPHLDNGGSIRDVTDAIHPETAACAVAAAHALRVGIAGIDVVVTDISRPLEAQGGGVVEVNTGPGLGLHTAPLNDSPRPVGAAIIASLFPPGSDGRIPVLAVTGSRAHTAGRCLAALLTDAGHRVGRAGRDGVFIAGRKINLEGATAYETALAVLRNALVDVAVLECEARDLLREGFACDRCDVVLITDPAEVEDSGDSARGDAEGSVEEVAEAWIALLHALAPDGKVVLNADDPPAPSSILPSSDRLLWFARTGDNVHVTRHRAAGGTAVFLSADSLVVARGVEEQRLAFGGRPGERDPREKSALLAALAGAMSLNQCGDEKPRAPRPLAAPVEAALSTV